MIFVCPLVQRSAKIDLDLIEQMLACEILQDRVNRSQRDRRNLRLHFLEDLFSAQMALAIIENTVYRQPLRRDLNFVLT